MLKAYFISALTQEEADELFTDQLVKRKEKLSDLENSYQELMTSSAEADSFSSPDFYYLVLTKALERERNYISWLEDILALIKKHKQNGAALYLHTPVYVLRTALINESAIKIRKSRLKYTIE